MSKIRSDSRVRTRGFTTITSNSSYDYDSYFTNKASGSDSRIRSDFRHWIRANFHVMYNEEKCSKSTFQNLF